MNDNAAIRENFVNHIYEIGVKERKHDILSSLPDDMAELHQKGYIHIHDLEAFGLVYNCCIPNIYNFINPPNEHFFTSEGKILYLFSQYKLLITSLGTTQSGGIGFANFDQEISDFFTMFHIPFTCTTQAFLEDAIYDFLYWINTTRTRYNREPYYISINLGLSTDAWGRFVTKTFLTKFLMLPSEFIRPNIIFKVSNDINFHEGTPNYDLYVLSLKTTAKKMIPTYLLLDSATNKNCDHKKLAIMGCRTRVYQNINGESTSIGRGNIAYVSINLPRLALENNTIESFEIALKKLLEQVIKLLVFRAESLRQHAIIHSIFFNNLWNNVRTVDDLIMQGTLSIGFIGLTETIQILTGNKLFNSKSSMKLAYEIINLMRKFIDDHRNKNSMNFSLLATPGEMLSGRFCEIDKALFHNEIHKKSFYTNSFHVDVDSHISIVKKIELEAPFHRLCNGGAITYVEFKESPIDNLLALQDTIAIALKNGISYLGFNYPLDICEECNMVGTFDQCKKCNSNKIKRIRRVSGYLEDANFFTPGKAAELKKRSSNE